MPLRTREELIEEALNTPLCSPCTSKVPPIIDPIKVNPTELILPLHLDCARCEREFSRKYPRSDRAGHTVQFVPMCKQHYLVWGIAEDVSGDQVCDHGVRIHALEPIPTRSNS